MSDIADRLRALADLFEAQQAPHNLVLHMRAGADEIERLRAGGCARDQSTTQYCAEAAMKDAEIASLLNTLADERTENMRLRAALEPFADVIKGNWSQQPDDLPLDVGFGATDLRLKLRLGDFRTARAALEGRT